MSQEALRIGPYQARTIVTSRFGLDGGAMYGSVPKALWQRETPADERNLISVVARALVLRGEGRTILVDTGTGHRFPETVRTRFDIDPGVDVAGALAQVGVEADDVTHVLLTHLHFDHCGGLFRGDEDRPEPAFKNARIMVQEANWERARDPGPKERASYRPEEVEPLGRCDLRLLHDNEEPLPGIRVRSSDGHTQGHQTVEVCGDETFLVFTGDLVPTASHLRLAFSAGFDMCAEWVIRDKKELLANCMARGGIVVFDHDPRTSGCRLGENEKGYFIREKIHL
jgi:glyoxylase-like metal-dependent hydrolase (beta-lactamase superfamily II)